MRCPAAEWRIPQWVDDLGDAFFRPICLVCEGPVGGSDARSDEDGESLVCGHCLRRIERVPEPFCHRCGSPLRSGGNRECETCHHLPPELGPVRSAAMMAGTGGILVRLFKYQGWESLARILAMEIVSSPWSDACFWDADLLVPVPISGVRRRERGFNQCEALARALSAMVGVPTTTGVLDRVSWARPQVGLSVRDRLDNVFGAFRAPPGRMESLSGKRVILVDDVMTTGSTLAACFHALRSGGADRIWGLSFGRADNPADF